VNDDRAPLLEVRSLTTEFVIERGGVPRAVRVVDDVSFAIGRGEVLALAGESGSGKSVTALSILRLVRPRAASAPAASASKGGNSSAWTNANSVASEERASGSCSRSR